MTSVATFKKVKLGNCTHFNVKKGRGFVSWPGEIIPDPDLAPVPQHCQPGLLHKELFGEKIGPREDNRLIPNGLLLKNRM